MGAIPEPYWLVHDLSCQRPNKKRYFSRGAAEEQASGCAHAAPGYRFVILEAVGGYCDPPERGRWFDMAAEPPLVATGRLEDESKYYNPHTGGQSCSCYPCSMKRLHKTEATNTADSDPCACSCNGCRIDPPF